MRRRGAPRVSALLVATGGIAGIILLVVFRAELAPPGRARAPALATEERGEQAPSLWPRRLPVAGRPGHFVVVHKDGNAMLEAPAGATPLSGPAESAMVARALEALRQPGRGGKLLVLDEGVVEVPESATITLIAKDRVVAIGADGVARAYHADGTVTERRPRPPVERKSVGKEKRR